MGTDSKVRFVQSNLIIWFETNKRNFRWRLPNASNYNRIISEVLLQRTKAETVNRFFVGFTLKYPNWQKLWEATESELVEVLKPLGLSSQRGKRLFKLAQDLKARNGVFPTTRSDVEEMPMMGQYISNAYELFVLNKRKPLLDVNMARVLERLFGARKLSDIRYDPYLQELAEKFVDHPQAVEVNWAVLDFAALVCKARKPLCDTCCLRHKCLFYKTQKLY